VGCLGFVVVDIFRAYDRMADLGMRSGLQAVIVRVMGGEKRRRGLIVDEAYKRGGDKLLFR
jgi:hypothetical protein